MVEKSRPAEYRKLLDLSRPAVLLNLKMIEFEPYCYPAKTEIVAFEPSCCPAETENS